MSPANNNCTVFSYIGWWQNDEEKLNVEIGGQNYLDHFLFCSRNPGSPKDSTNLHLPCLGEYGGTIDPNVVLGMYLFTVLYKVLIKIPINNFTNAFRWIFNSYN